MDCHDDFKNMQPQELRAKAAADRKDGKMTTGIALTDLAAALADQGVRASYRGLYEMILSGQMPGARRLPNGRWSVDCALPEVAQAYLECHPSAAVAA